MNIIFTDGSSRGNPGPGGWGVVIVLTDESSVINHVKRKEHPVQVVELGGRADPTTNNRMELTAVCESLKQIKTLENVTVLTDSAYVINGATRWIKGWQRNGWKTKTKDDVVNKDLWLELEGLVRGGNIVWKHIDGHAGIIGNERCDEIATAFADNLDIKLYRGPLAGYAHPNIADISVNVRKADAKNRDRSRSKAKAYSYVSSINGVTKIHDSWIDCEKRVKGARGARFKKALNASDEDAIVEEFKSAKVKPH